MKEAEALEGQRVGDRQRSHFRRGEVLQGVIMTRHPTHLLLAQVPALEKGSVLYQMSF